MKHFYSLGFFLFVLLISLNSATAQDNYLAGVIVNNSGDTIKGLIDYKNWGINPDKIYFKAVPNSVIQVYKPSLIKSFKVADEIYLSAKVQMEVSPEVSNLNKDGEFHFTTDSVFIQTLIEGSKSLYYYKSSTGKSNFYILNDGNYDLLKHKKFIKITSNNTILTENKKYIGQLTVYLSDCENLASKIEKAKYSQHSLMNLFESYYRCTRQTMIFKKNEEKIILEKGIFAGMSSTTLKITSDVLSQFPEFETSNDLTMGVSLDVIFPRNQRMWSIVNEINFTKFMMEDNYVNKSKDTVQIELGYRFIKINNMLRLSYPLNDFRLFINAGLANGFPLIKTNQIKTTPDGPYFNTPKESTFLKSRKHEISILGGAGVRYKKLSFEYRIEVGKGLSRNPILCNTFRNYLLLGYKF